MILKYRYSMKKLLHFLLACTSLVVLLSTQSCNPGEDDNTAPTIYLYGSNPTYVKLFTPYTDTLISITDASGVLETSVDTSAYNGDSTGVYIVTYHAKDTEGNTSSATRTFIVRIEGSTLAGKYKVLRTQPYPSDDTLTYFEQLTLPETKGIYSPTFANQLLAKVKIELSNKTGDTLKITRQVVSFTPTSITYVNASGVASHTASSFYLDYTIINDNSDIIDDTIKGRLLYTPIK